MTSNLLGSNNCEQLRDKVSQFKVMFHVDFFLRQSVAFICISKVADLSENM